MRTQPSKNAEKASEKRVLQFGSVDFVSEKAFGGFNVTSSSEKHSSKGEPLDLVKKDSELKDGKGVHDIDNQPRNKAAPTENGRAHDATRSSLYSNGVQEVKVNNNVGTSTFEFKKVDGFSNEFSSLNLHNGEQNGSVGDFSVPFYKEEHKKAVSNGQLIAARNLLPRGLINSGNLCFLNASVQALLSCSPFVQLLQELRTSNISKVSL